MKTTAALNLLDIPWLRRSGRKEGVLDAPANIAVKLLSCGLVERSAANVLTITARGRIALTRLA